MTEIIVRDAVPADREAMAEVYRSCHPALLVSVASIAHAARAFADAGLGEFVAESGGRVVGVGTGWLNTWSAEEGAVAVDVAVRPELWRRGVGTLLMERIERHVADLGGKVVSANAESPGGIAFAARHGFAAGRVAWLARRALGETVPAVDVPDGVRILRLSEVDDLRALHESESLAALDIPADRAVVPTPFEQWKARLLDDPRLDHDLSVVAFVGETVGAMAYIQRLGDRVHSSFTGTHPDFRGRGLATVLKSHALRAAREAGATEAFTSNDAKNAPMLAVNTRLGYEPFLERTSLRREAAPGTVVAG